MQNSPKLESFNTFNNDYAPPSYLSLPNKQSERKEPVKLRPVDMIRCQGLMDFALFEHPIKLKTNLTFLYIAINTLF